jgi:peroxiredoxin
MAKKLGLTIPILTDRDNALAARFALVFTLPDALREVYLSFGIDLERHNGNPSWSLPMPACYIIGQDGTILDAAVNVDHTNRPEPEETLSKLKALTGQ